MRKHVLYLMVLLLFIANNDAICNTSNNDAKVNLEIANSASINILKGKKPRKKRNKKAKKANKNKGKRSKAPNSCPAFD